MSEGHTKLVDYFLNECLLDPSLHGQKIVYDATRKKYNGILYQLLTDKRVNVEIIFYVSINTGNVEMINYILQNNFIKDLVKYPVNVKWDNMSYGENSALKTAAYYGYARIVQVLLKNDQIRSNLHLHDFTGFGYKHESVARVLGPYLKDQITDIVIHNCISSAIRNGTDQTSVDYLIDILHVPLNVDSAERILYCLRLDNMNFFENDMWVNPWKMHNSDSLKYLLKRITQLLGHIYDRYMTKTNLDNKRFQTCMIESLVVNGLELTTDRFIALIENLKQQPRRYKDDWEKYVFTTFINNKSVDPTYDDHYLFWASIYDGEYEGIFESLIKRSPYSNMTESFRNRINLVDVPYSNLLNLARTRCYPIRIIFEQKERMRGANLEEFITVILKFPELQEERKNYPNIWNKIILDEQNTLQRIKPVYKHFAGSPELFHKILECLPEIFEKTSIEGTKTKVIERWVNLCL